MRTIGETSRGGHRGGYRGRGRGGRGGRPHGEDKRFVSRFTDPRFQASSSGRGGRGRGQGRPQRGGRGHHNSREDAATQDPRFAKYFTEAEPQEDEEEENEEMEEVDENASDVAVSDVGEDEAAALDEDAQAWSGSEDLEFCEARRRVAIVNCDWDHVRAVDLYAILFHALPLGGQLKDVKVYLSDFGKERLEHERIHGPDLWVKPGEADSVAPELAEPHMEEIKDDEDNEYSDDESEPGSEEDDGWKDDNPTMMEEEGEDGEKFSSGKYRKYERDRLKYYYAIATFDSADTAAAVYADLDGMDIEASGVVLDLRYVDDDETFGKPVQEASKIPPNFRPLSSFKAAAMSQTKFRISWDQDDVHRHHSIRDSFTGVTEEDDLGAYIAGNSSSEEDYELDPTAELRKAKREEKKRKLRQRYAALLSEIGGIPDELPEDDDDKVSNDGEDDDDLDEGSSDDDDLNRFSDVDDEEDEESDGSVNGNVEGTMDFDADTKASRLQRDAAIKKALRDGDIGTQTQLKYKLQRKENRKSKKEMILAERAAERAALDAQASIRKKALKKAIGDQSSDDHEPLSGKEKRKIHAKATKERLAKERDEKKTMRLANRLGVEKESIRSRKDVSSEPAEAEDAGIDSRFKSKLMSDPRFHLDVAQKDKRTNADVVKLASRVVKERQEVAKSSRKNAVRSAPSASDEAADFFLSRPSKKARRE